MKLPSETVSSETLISYAVYTSVKLSAKKDTKELALPVKNAIDDLKKKNKDTKNKDEERSAKLAMRDEKDNDCDKSVIAFSLELLSSVGNNREDPRYKNVFFKIPSEIVNEPIKEEIEDLKLLEERMSSDINNSVYKKHLPVIKNNRAGLEQAQMDFENSLNEEKNSYGMEKMSQAELRRILVKTYGRLIELKGKKEAEGYFKKFSSKKKQIK